MPTYDYECSAGHTFEHTVSIAERDGKVKCPCGKRAKRLFSPTVNMYTIFNSESQTLIARANSVTKAIERRQESQGYGPTVERKRAATMRKPPKVPKAEPSVKELAATIREVAAKKNF